MDKKEISEIKKTLNLKKGCCIHRISTAYVNEDKRVIAATNRPLLQIGDEEAFQYLNILKGVLSGGKDKKLYDISFPIEEEQNGGKQECLYKINQDAKHVIDTKIYDEIIAGYDDPGKFLIVIGFGTYDVPAKAKDGADLDDSEIVYDYMIVGICPVVALNPGLCLDDKKNTVSAGTDIWTVDKPYAGFLFPAFTGRQSDIHAALFYTKNAKNKQEDLANSLFGAAPGLSSDEEKLAFASAVENAFGDTCSFEKVKEVTDAVANKAALAKTNDIDAEISKRELRRLLEKAGADNDGLKKFDENFPDTTKDLSVANIADSATKITSDYINLSIKSENNEYIENRVINGREYLLIPVADNLAVNGIAVKANSASRNHV